MADGKVVGIGGVFIRSADPARLAAWYRDHLGFVATEAGKPAPDGSYTWAQEAGDTVFSAFPATTEYWQAERQIMLNLRVEGLEPLLERLATQGIAASHREAMDGVGKFARISDCDGNPIELWEPVG